MNKMKLKQLTALVAIVAECRNYLVGLPDPLEIDLGVSLHDMMPGRTPPSPTADTTAIVDWLCDGGEWRVQKRPFDGKVGTPFRFYLRRNGIEAYLGTLYAKAGAMPTEDWARHPARILPGNDLRLALLHYALRRVPYDHKALTDNGWTKEAVEA